MTRHIDESDRCNSSPRAACLRTIHVLALLAGLALQYGCEGPDNGKGQPAIYTWAKQFGVVSLGQGVAGSAPYTPGAGVTVLPIYYNTAGLDWFYGALIDENDDPLVPAGLIPADKSSVQLVLIETASSQKAAHSFFHWTCHYDLREALTGRLVASKDFAGDNVNPDPDPYVDHWVNGGPVTYSDRQTIVPNVRAWLGGYVD